MAIPSLLSSIFFFPSLLPVSMRFDFGKVALRLLAFLAAALIGAVVTWLFDPKGRYFGFFLDVKRNAKKLTENAEHLERRMKDVEDTIADAEKDRRQRRTDAADGWIKMVKAKKQEVDGFTEDYKRWEARSSTLSRLWSRYSVAKRAGELLEEVLDLLKTGESLVAVRRPATLPVQERNNKKMVRGLESDVEKVLDYLRAPDVRIVGIYGIGGVGKTALLTMINNKLANLNTGFDHVVWATVSRDVNLERLQEDMARSLGVSLPEKNASLDSRAQVIFTYLNDKRFLLLLDDLWAPLDLAQLGIPHLDVAHPYRNMVLTTRSEEVCSAMVADMKKIKRKCLDIDPAWELFKTNLGENSVDSDPQIRDLAKAVAKRCRGLPLALIVIGRAVSNNKTVEDWENDLEALNNSEPTASGMEDQDMFPILQHSYDRLKDDRMRKCFLCCSLWPEDFNIRKEELVECWMGMGLIEEERHGAGIIKSLKAACLLEPGDDEQREVKMHDVIRDMALRIASARWVVKAGAGLSEVPDDVQKRAQALERVSLMRNNITALEQRLDCPNLLSMMLQENKPLRHISNGFFSCMPALTYLNLSRTVLNKLPIEIGMLRELQYLNLSSTHIRSLPREMASLGKLRYLIMRNTYYLSKWPCHVLASPSMLRTLDLYGSRKHANWDAEGNAAASLHKLKALKTLGITVGTVDTLKWLSIMLSNVSVRWLSMTDLSDTSLNLGRCLESLNVGGRLQDLELSKCSELEKLEIDLGEGYEGCGYLPKLETLQLSSLSKLKEIIWTGVVAESFLPRLHSLYIGFCHKLKNINWVLQLPCLEALYLWACDDLEVIIDDGEVGDAAKIFAFPKLKRFRLKRLPKLSSICGYELDFPSLQYIVVDECTELKRLPFRSQITSYKIFGSIEWWEGLQWNDDNIKSSLLPYVRFHS